MNPTLHGYTLVKTIGRGSYGVVWLAKDTQGIWRAVKVIKAGDLDAGNVRADEDAAHFRRKLAREQEGIRRFRNAKIGRAHV